jgi:glutamyl-tRNA reductase
LDLAAAQKATQSRSELRKKAHEYVMVAEKIGSHLLTSTASSKAAVIGHGTAIAMAMNHLANQAFYTWKVLDHHAHASQHAGEFLPNIWLMYYIMHPHYC